MEVKRFVNNPFQEISYLLYDETKEAVIIDCGCSNTKEQQRLLDFIERKELKLVKVLNTHLHIDHIAGNAFLKDHFGLSPMAHEGDIFIYERAPEQAATFGFPMEKTPPKVGTILNEGDVVEFGKEKLHVLHVPGHSPGSICFYNKEENVMIVGDVLFQGSVGRTDLWEGDTDTLINGIKTKILSLSDEIVIAPGHGNTTTIGEERQRNPYLQ
ncbi:MAG: MBL fold metallo-hydrolase [Bacteroidales bacterium]|jgi:hydroxyacylglutathione hydrolase|nr:MBL fold metallo-hydrolase [Bacteroidales bacterium]